MMKLQLKGRERLVLTTGFLLVTLLAFAGGVSWHRHTVDERVASEKARSEQYSLLARRLLIDEPNDVIIDFRGLQSELEAYITTNSLQEKVSLNFEYLPTGSSIGIGEDDPQVGASLLKLPLAMGVYKAHEQGKLSLDTHVPLRPEWLNSKYGTLYQKGAGYDVTVREAARQALSYSDNTAALLLFDQVSRAQNTSTPDLLGFIDANYSETKTQEVLIDSRSYSAILKCLYFACFLNKDHSQELLGYLQDSRATNRLARYIPSNVTVAHKIGTFNQETQSDCGIVYLPKRNYVICIMVDGGDAEASARIAELSSVVYKYLAE